MIERSEVLSFQHVDAVDADATKLVGQIVLSALEPIGDVLGIGHRRCATNDVHSRGYENGEVMAAGGKPEKEPGLNGVGGDVFFF